jgi:hypothetical protein
MTVFGNKLLVCAGTGGALAEDSAVLFTVDVDATVVVIKTFQSYHGSAIAVDGEHIVVGLVTINSISLAYDNGDRWVVKELARGYFPILSVALSGNTIVAAYEEEQNGAPTALITSVSHNAGNKWSSVTNPDGYGNVLGFIGDRLFAEVTIPGSSDQLYTLSDAGNWIAVPGAPPGDDLTLFSLSVGGYWYYKSHQLIFVPILDV